MSLKLKPVQNFKEYLAIPFVILWAYLIVKNPHEPLIVGAMITIISGSIVAFYYGSTKAGSDTATKNAETVTAAARTTEPQSVIVENTATDPIPVETK